MKKIHGIFLGGMTLLVALLMSCQEDKTIPEPQPKEPTSQVKVDLIGGFDEFKTVTFEIEDVARKVRISPAGNWTTHCFIRKQGASFVGVATINFNAVRGTNGKIKLTPVSKNVTVTGIPAGQEPKKGEFWYMMAIAGGGELVGGNKVSFAYKPALDDPLESTPDKVRVPLASGWTKVKAIDNNYLEGALTFRPQGVLLRMRLMNRIDKDVVADDFYLTSSVASREGHFDLSGDVVEGAAPKWVFDQRPTSLDPYYAEIAVPQTLPSSSTSGTSGIPPYSAYKLVWVMLDSQAPSSTPIMKISSLKFKLNRHGDPVVIPSGGDLPPFSVHLKSSLMANGKTHPVNIELLRYKTSAEYVAPRNVAPTPGIFAIDNSVSTSGYYRLPLSGIEDVIPVGYHLPNENEWQALFSPSFQQIKLDGNPGGAISTPQRIDEAVEINNEKNTFYGYYVSKKVGTKITTYALRFMPYTGAATPNPNFPAYVGYHKVAAFKYEIVDYDQLPAADKANSYGVGKQLKVTTRFLGRNASISEVSDPTFWSTASTEQVSVVFPLCGYVNSAKFSGDPNAGFSQVRSQQQMKTMVTGWNFLQQGYYWSITAAMTPYLQRMDTNETTPYNVAQGTTDMYVIRPFVNSLD